MQRDSHSSYPSKRSSKPVVLYTGSDGATAITFKDWNRHRDSAAVRKIEVLAAVLVEDIPTKRSAEQVEKVNHALANPTMAKLLTQLNLLPAAIRPRPMQPLNALQFCLRLTSAIVRSVP